jgi:TRAP-type C4-dicarboxylate transport system permease small subunit
MFEKIYDTIDKIVVGLVFMGAIIVLIQVVWISYGVFVRYALNSPDGMVTEATALLLVPVAFAGLAYALREDAYPKVTMLTDLLSVSARLQVERLNLLLKIAIGVFFSIASVSAAYSSYLSGAASEILLWPRFLFWIPVAFSLCVFSLYSTLRFIRSFIPNQHSAAEE